MLYYYCKNTTFVSIVKNHSLWLSDMTQSNDSYEIHRYIEIVKNAIQQELSALPKASEIQIPQKGPKRKMYEQIENQRAVYAYALRRLERLKKEYYCLAICFSDRGDNLSQWRGYGDDGCGISIGFDEEMIESLSKQHVLFKYDDVKYYSSDSDGIIREKLQEYLEELENISIDAGNSPAKRNAAVKNLCTRILDNDAPFFKPAGFIEERETRFCFVRYIHAVEIANPKENSHLKDVDFHVGINAIVPHYELKLCDMENNPIPDIIREVTIGPCNDSDRNTISAFLAKYGFDYNKIKVEKSIIPYRTRR